MIIGSIWGLWKGLSEDPLGPPPGTPSQGPPGGPPGPGPGPGRAPGAPGRPARRPPPGGPARPPRGPENRAIFGPILGGLYILLYSCRGGILGVPQDPPKSPPRGRAPGGEKSAHFFGYLITLPVGTVWALFLDPPGTPPGPPFGPYPGSTPGAPSVGGRLLWPDKGGGQATGPFARSYAQWGVRARRTILPCKHGSARSIVRLRECANRLREPNAIGAWSDRQDAARASQSQLDRRGERAIHPLLSVRT